MNNKYVSWRRVSTFKQSKSGLGLEAQKEIIRYFVNRDGGKLIADYSECYTGTELSGCVELRKAMARAKKENAILVIAKSDRFRNCQEALGILDEMGEGHLEFCDLPHSDRFTLTLFWALAEREALITSIRTKQALAEKKRQGCKLGAKTDKWKASYEAKSDEQKAKEFAKRGATNTKRFLEGRDAQVFFKVLRMVFPDACIDDNVEHWRWGLINTKYENRTKILQLMRDYKDMDESKKTFAKWNFDMDATKLQVKLAAYIQSFRRSIFKV